MHGLVTAERDGKRAAEKAGKQGGGDAVRKAEMRIEQVEGKLAAYFANRSQCLEQKEQRVGRAAQGRIEPARTVASTLPVVCSGMLRATPLLAELPNSIQATGATTFTGVRRANLSPRRTKIPRLGCAGFG